MVESTVFGRMVMIWGKVSKEDIEMDKNREYGKNIPLLLQQKENTNMAKNTDFGQ